MLNALRACCRRWVGGMAAPLRVGWIIIVLRPQFLSLPRILFLFVFVVAVWLVVKHI